MVTRTHFGHVPGNEESQYVIPMKPSTFQTCDVIKLFHMADGFSLFPFYAQRSLIVSCPSPSALRLLPLHIFIKNTNYLRQRRKGKGY